MDIFVPDYDWNSHWGSVEESVSVCDYAEGEEFTMVRLTVGAATTYKIVDGKPTPTRVAFPDPLPSNVKLRGAL